MERLWGKMMSLYGRQWEASYGHVDGEAFNDWNEALQSVKLDDIARGVQAIIDEANEFPPNLIKFLRMCRKPFVHASHKTFNPEPRLTQQDPGAAERHFKAARELLGPFKRKERDND